MNIPDSWMNDAELSDIDPVKLQFLSLLFQQGGQYTGKDIMPFLSTLSQKMKENNIHFESQELKKIIHVFQKYGTDQENSKINKAIELMNQKKS